MFSLVTFEIIIHYLELPKTIILCVKNIKWKKQLLEKNIISLESDKGEFSFYFQ